MSAKREEILDAALEIADERGLAGVSMRAVAQAVGVTPMALYPHVRDKAGLLDGMLGRMLGRLYEEAPELADHNADWRRRLAAFAHTARHLSTGHPWATALLFARPAVTPDAVRTVDFVYCALLDAGVPHDEVPRLERLVSTFVLGWIASEAGGRFGPDRFDPRGHRGDLPDGPLPGHTAIAHVLRRPTDWNAEFATDLADLEQLVLAAARRGRRPPRTE
ncbi:TetR/AcrR family transcriptional regulator [Streptomyces sp. CBMA29]|uniref:TetR/AcrR family transcriptional regulator n=1 Tax=Streptomyces sp. CBMA29 TaxID=1896314 RepID=UPI001661C48E|nr:TetR/AcrR family transcriptional regulator [Streptomyces sp. CBMA29]MBD0740024.1 TetR family transcriptional regulator [Streptomyces sp. CBMA29]